MRPDLYANAYSETTQLAVWPIIVNCQLSIVNSHLSQVTKECKIMPHTIAVAGKGGVGKTTTCGMLIDYL